MAAGLRLSNSSQGFFYYTFQTHFVQLIKPSQVSIRPTGIQALPSPVNFIIITTFTGAEGFASACLRVRVYFKNAPRVKKGLVVINRK